MSKKGSNIALFLALIGLAFLIQSSLSQTPKHSDKQHYITIWIHGTLPTAFSPKSIIYKFEFIKRFFYCKKGLNLAIELDKKYHMRTIAQTLNQVSTELFSMDSFYFFGWSGNLRTCHREKAAKLLYEQLSDLVHQYYCIHQKQPYIRIICFSHGGNVALLLSRHCKRKQCPFFINELILLACPVQEETRSFLKHMLFKKIYSIHSHYFDLLQVLDPQGLHILKNILKNVIKNYSWKGLKNAWESLKKLRLFSERHFQPQDNLTQICLKLNWRYPMHIDFLLKPFLKSLPSILDKADILTAKKSRYIQKSFVHMKIKTNE